MPEFQCDLPTRSVFGPPLPKDIARIVEPTLRRIVEGDQSPRLDAREIAGCAERDRSHAPRNVPPERVGMRKESLLCAFERLRPQHGLVLTRHDFLLLHAGLLLPSYEPNGLRRAVSNKRTEWW